MPRGVPSAEGARDSIRSDPRGAAVKEGRRVTIEAAPAPIDIDLSRTAALVIDMQNDFGSKGGMFERAGIDIAPIRATIAPTRLVLGALRACGVPIVYVKMGYRPDLSDLGSPGSPNRERHLKLSVGCEVAAPNGEPSRILVRDTWNTNVIDELEPERGDLELYKTRFSGFHGTELDAVLRRRGVEFLIVSGCTTSVCVESTIRDAMFLDYSCLLLSDCAAEPVGSDLPRTNHQASLLVLQALFGWVSDSGALLRVLS
jgi:ureidoacrylate peracid hydrolase